MTGKTDWSDWILAAATVGVLAAGAWTFYNEHRLMSECMADGHKRYECAAMLRRAWW